LRHVTDVGARPQTPTALLLASEKTGTEENDKKTMYTFMSFEQRAGKYENVRTDYEFFGSVAHYKLQRTAIFNQNIMHE
jgi:hypothetical protein